MSKKKQPPAAVSALKAEFPQPDMALETPEDSAQPEGNMPNVSTEDVDQLSSGSPVEPLILKIEFVTKGRHPTTKKPVLELSDSPDCSLDLDEGGLGIVAFGKRARYLFPWSNIAVVELPRE